jgi:hypothetical protein
VIAEVLNSLEKDIGVGVAKATMPGGGGSSGSQGVQTTHGVVVGSVGRCRV